MGIAKPSYNLPSCDPGSHLLFVSQFPGNRLGSPEQNRKLVLQIDNNVETEGETIFIPMHLTIQCNLGKPREHAIHRNPQHPSAKPQLTRQTKPLRRIYWQYSSIFFHRQLKNKVSKQVSLRNPLDVFNSRAL